MKELLTKFSRLDSRTKMIGLGILLALIFFLDVFLLIRPQLHHYVTFGKKTREFRHNIDSTVSNIERARSLRSEVENLKKTVYDLERQLTPKDSVSAVLERISLIAGRNFVDIDLIVPDINNQNVLFEKNEKKYIALPIALKVKSTYHDFGRFVSALESDSLFIRMENFSIAGSASGVSEISLDLKALMFEGPKIIADEHIPEENPAEPEGAAEDDGSRVNFSEKFPGVPQDAIANMRVYDGKPLKDSRSSR